MGQPNSIYFGYSVAMTEQQCITCGTCFAIPKVMDDQLKESKRAFYCPSGHSQVYRESDADRLRRQLATFQAATVEANRLRWVAEEARTKVEKKLKRTEKRIKNGVCPCCQRSFMDIKRHIATKHPDFTHEPAK